MKKFELIPMYYDTIPKGCSHWDEKLREHVSYRLLTDEQTEWLFENTKGKFILDGFFIIFENDEDALGFKLRWLT